MKIKKEDEIEGFIDFLRLMVIQCQVLCTFRELLGISPEDFAKAIGLKTSSSISKLEAKNENDGLKTKLKALRYLKISTPYYSGLADDALLYFEKNWRKLMGVEEVARLLEIGPKHFGASIDKKCKDAEHYAMRIGILLVMAHACDFKIEPLEQEILNNTWKEGKAELVLKRDKFEESVEAWEEVNYFLKRETLKKIWEQIESNAKSLKEKNRQIMSELKVWRREHE